MKKIFVLICLSTTLGLYAQNEEARSSAKTILEPHIGLSTKNREALGKILNKILSDEYVLYAKTLNYHWNVYGPLFHDLHGMFREQYEMLSKIIDDVAERARALGIHAYGSLTKFIENTQLKESADNNPKASAMITHLLNDHEAIIRTLRKDIDKAYDNYHDIGTNNFLTEVMQKHEKIAWMLRSAI